MDIILIPGLWLDAASWNRVVPALQASGHRTHALTMPGVGAAAADSREIGIADWISAATATLDSIGRPAVVVGHSGGGNVAWGVADARPDHVARVVLVDTVPPPAGHGISEFDTVDGVVPFPGWEFFPDEEVRDLDAQTRDRTAALALSVPARVPTDPIMLTNPDRFRVPVTLLMGSFDQAAFETEIEEWGPYAEEYRRIIDREVIRIGSGHWPQFSVPDRLAALIADAVSR